MIYHQNVVACFVVCQIPCHGKNCPKRGEFLKKRVTPFIGRLVLVVIGLSANHYPSAWYWLFVALPCTPHGLPPTTLQSMTNVQNQSTKARAISATQCFWFLG